MMELLRRWLERHDPFYALDRREGALRALARVWARAIDVDAAHEDSAIR